LATPQHAHLANKSIYKILKSVKNL